jgi:hypothetical protein
MSSLFTYYYVMRDHNELGNYWKGHIVFAVMLFGEMTWIFGFLIFWIRNTWWRLFQKRIVHTKFDIYVSMVESIFCGFEVSCAISSCILLWLRGPGSFSVIWIISRASFKHYFIALCVLFQIYLPAVRYII